MNRARAAAVAFVVAVASAGASSASPADVAAAVRAVLDTQVEAWNRGDLEGFMAGYWRSPDLVFCSGATVTRGWDETLARYRKRYQSEGREMGRLRFDGIEILTLGADAALARGAWRIVHDHTSSGE